MHYHWFPLDGIIVQKMAWKGVGSEKGRYTFPWSVWEDAACGTDEQEMLSFGLTRRRFLGGYSPNTHSCSILSSAALQGKMSAA